MRTGTARLVAVAAALCLGIWGCPAREARHDHEHAGPTRKGPVTYAELGLKPYPGSKPWGKQPMMRFVHEDAEAATLLSRVVAKPAEVERHYADQLSDIVRKPTKDGCRIDGANSAGQKTTLQFLHEPGGAVRTAITVTF